jgi:molybdopterin converting factor small subunit
VEGSSVRDALASLDVEEVAYGATVLNSEQASEDDPLRDGDVLYVFPPASGG